MTEHASVSRASQAATAMLAALSRMTAARARRCGGACSCCTFLFPTHHPYCRRRRPSLRPSAPHFTSTLVQTRRRAVPRAAPAAKALPGFTFAFSAAAEPPRPSVVRSSCPRWAAAAGAASALCAWRPVVPAFICLLDHPSPEEVFGCRLVRLCPGLGLSRGRQCACTWPCGYLLVCAQTVPSCARMCSLVCPRRRPLLYGVGAPHGRRPWARPPLTSYPLVV